MRVIYKYPVYHGTCTIHISGNNPKPVKLGMQYGSLYMWVEHDTYGSSLLEAQVVATGQAVDFSYNHIDTYFDGDYVWHLYTKNVI